MAIKILGYVLALLGLVGIAAWVFPELKSSIPSVNQLGDTLLIIVSLVVALVGVFIVAKIGGGRREKEVPIYHGKHIVGYRRH